MSSTAKIAIIVLCFSVCGAATFITSTAREKSEPQKANAIPVENRELRGSVWLRV
jgi:hypothetical protein